MFHLDRGGSRVDRDGMRNEVGFPISSNGDHICKLEEDPNDLFSQVGIPLEQWLEVEAEVSH